MSPTAELTAPAGATAYSLGRKPQDHEIQGNLSPGRGDSYAFSPLFRPYRGFAVRRAPIPGAHAPGYMLPLLRSFKTRCQKLGVRLV